MNTQPFTQDEQLIMEHLRKAMILFATLKPTSPGHREQFAKGINNCQDVIGHRVLQRNYPEVYSTHD